MSCLLVVGACATGGAIGAKQEPAALPVVAIAARAAGSFDLLFVTDRAPVTSEDGKLSYGADRARFLSFGTVEVLPKPGAALVASNGSTAQGQDELQVGAINETGRFPLTPYAVEATPKGARRAPQTVIAHERAEDALKAEVSRRLAMAPRKEVVVFIHGYNNTFEDAALATGDICRSLGNEFVCIVLTWPAGGSGGVFMGYNVDRESGEFAVADLKKAIRIIAETKGVERVHLIAHSRGTDVTVNIIQQLGIETYVSQSSLWQRYKIANLVLFAPDIDLDVARTKIIGLISDPDLLFGSSARPDVVFPPQGALHLTVYSSPNDKALRLSTFLFGSFARLGQLSVGQVPKDRQRTEEMLETSSLASFFDFIEFTGSAGFIGHSYFLSDPAVNADLVALIRDRVKAGDPRRALVEVKRPFWRISDQQQASR